ncbi:MAG: 2-hydroxychromene-2-carboxylate isomerase [Alphaproteobacteria bacterium]|nr:2-hydroxychromene-2-carboxylate isomerase [Alphaproteobacteria bacterium]
MARLVQSGTRFGIVALTGVPRAYRKQRWTLARLEFFFDVSSPWTYLAFTRIHDVARRTGAQIVWKPILVGGVFNAVNREVYERRAHPDPRKASYSGKDLQDWARLAGIVIGKPAVFPVRAVTAMRCVLAAQEQGALVELSRAMFEAYWRDLKDIGQTEVLEETIAATGLDPEDILSRAGSAEIKERLKANTEEVIARGGFGSPTMFVDGDDMYFGNDRLPLVEAALMRDGFGTGAP